jgi:DNA-binding transcriptional LysR family regulator
VNGYAQPPAGIGGILAVRPDDVVVNPVRLAVFCMVAEHRNFTRAAEVLSVTQPTVSGHIRVLEEWLGTRLFDRHQHGVRLTEAGQATYDFAVTVLRDMAILRARADELAGGEGGAVILGAETVTASYLLPDLLAEFHHRHPRAYIHLRVLTPAVIGEEVLHGRLDFGIVNEAMVLPSLKSESLWVDTILVIAPPVHRLARAESVGLADLANEPFVVGAAPTLGDRALDQSLVRLGLGPRQVVMRVGNLEGVKQAVVRGVGLGIVYRQVVAAELADRKLVALNLAELAITEQFFCIRRHPDRETPLAGKLMEFIRSRGHEIMQHTWTTSD